MPKLPKISGVALLKWFARLYVRPLESLEKVVATVGKVVAFDGGKYQKLHFVSDPAYIKHILKTNKANYKRSPVIKALRPLLGNGIFISENKDWQSQRSHLKPSFHEHVILQFESIIQEECDILCNDWKHTPGIRDVEADMEMLMLRILVRTQFCDGIEVDYKEIHRAHNEVLSQTSIRNQKIKFYANRFRKFVGFSTSVTPQSTAVTYLDTVARHIIAFARNNRKNCSYWLNDMFDRHVDEAEIRDQILNFIFAGYDTTASALTWTLYCLATNVVNQNECQQEAQNTQSTFANLSKLQITKQCFQESIRLYPPVWSIHRQSMAKDDIESQPFDAQTYFMICAYTLHRDPDYWVSPADFKPERFSSENMRGKAFQYIPFGQGERVCIGQSLAIMESQLIVSNLLREFHLTYNQKKPPQITPGIIMKTRSGLLLDVAPISVSTDGM